MAGGFDSMAPAVERMLRRPGRSIDAFRRDRHAFRHQVSAMARDISLETGLRAPPASGPCVRRPLSCGCPRPTDADVRKLDRASRVLVAAVSANAAVRARSRYRGSL